MGLSFQALKDLWIQAGGSPAQAPVAAAIALAESGGNPQSHNAVPPDNSYGLWQINMLGSMGPSRRSQFGLSSDAQLFDPLTNAKAAVAISNNGSNFHPWSTFTNGAYKAHLNGQGAGTGTAQTVGLVGSGTLGDAIGSALGQLFGAGASAATGGAFTLPGALSAMFNDVGTIVHGFLWLAQPASWLRIGAFFVGALFLSMGTVSLFGAIKN